MRPRLAHAATSYLLLIAMAAILLVPALMSFARALHGSTLDTSYTLHTMFDIDDPTR